MYPLNQICAVEVTEYNYSGSFRAIGAYEEFDQPNYLIESARNKLKLKEGLVTFPRTVNSLTNGSIHESSCLYTNKEKVCFSFSAKVSSVITHRIEGVHYQILWEDYLGVKFNILRKGNVSKVGSPISSELEELLYQELKENSE